MTEPTPPARPRVVVVTGISGAGKRTAAHALEDLGFYTVDNLPPSMLLPLLDLAVQQGIGRVAVVVDVRSRQAFDELKEIFEAVEESGSRLDVVFLDASDEVIVTRQEGARRPVPLQGDGRLMDGVARERSLLGTLRAAADLVIDTSQLNVHQLRQRIGQAYGGPDANQIRIALVSFGFKHGLPFDADMVFDVRFLPNPHWVPELRPQTGLDAPVRDYVLSQEAAAPYLDDAVRLVRLAAEGYVREGKRLATIAVGCTGGKHRSTAMAEELARRLREAGLSTSTIHRDLGRE